MLASLLPGLRQVRTPLAVGYFWLLNLSLVFADYLPRKVTGGLAGDIFEIGDWLGKGAILAALSLSAYLIGSLNVVPPTTFMRPILSLRLRYGAPGVPEPFFRAFWDLRRRQRLAHNTTFDDLKQVTKRAIGQRFDLRTKLLVADKELYGEYDRLESEAEFRVNIAIPLAAFIGILAWKFNLLWLLGLIPTIMIFWQGAAREFEALAVLIRAILAGKIEASKGHEFNLK